MHGYFSTVIITGMSWIGGAARSVPTISPVNITSDNKRAAGIFAYLYNGYESSPGTRHYCDYCQIQSWGGASPYISGFTFIRVGFENSATFNKMRPGLLNFWIFPGRYKYQNVFMGTRQL